MESERERAHNREAFAAMGLRDKARYVLAYYKLPIVLAVVALVAVGSWLHGRLTRREVALYVAYANVAVDEGADADLWAGYLSVLGREGEEVTRYRDLYLTGSETPADHQYAYASRLKLMAATDAGQLDVVFADAEAWELLSRSGYLMELSELAADPGLSARLEPLLREGEVVISDNQVELDLSEADAYEATIERHPNALRVDGLSSLDALNLSGPTYLCVIANTPRTEEVRALLAYL